MYIHQSSDEATPLLERNPLTKVYRRRWYILGLFSLMAMLQDTIWNTWGPIEHTVVFLFAWSPQLVALFANYGSILYILAFIPAIYILQRSLRVAVLLSIGLMTLGTLMRCIKFDDAILNDIFFTVSCHICAILNGISNIVVGSAPLAISAAWFPVEERLTATTVAQVFNGLGTGTSFLLASQIVRPIDEIINDHSHNITDAEIRGLKQDVQWYMLSNFIPSSIMFILILSYFPSTPQLPPSISSFQERLDFMAGFKIMLRNPAAWLIAIGSSIPQGIVVAWTAMMVVNLINICVADACLTQHWVNYLGIVATVVSTFMAIVIAKALDAMKDKLKQALIGLFGLAAFVFLILSLISIGVFHFNSILSVQISVYILLLTGNTLVVSSMPLSMELAMEICYPVPEGVVGGWISIWFNIITVIFLSLFSVPGIGSSWLNYVLPIACVLAIPLIVPIRVEYKRMKLDIDQRRKDSVKTGTIYVY